LVHDAVELMEKVNSHPYSVPVAWDAHPAAEVYEWCVEQFGYQHFDHDWLVDPDWNVDTYRFKEEKHMLWFIMRWS
jgi:hypothetical protein